MQLYKYISLRTIERIDTLQPDTIDADEFINRLLDHYIGSDCSHKNQHLYLQLPVDEYHMLDRDAVFTRLNNICFGKETPFLVRGCPDCGRMSIVKRN